MNPLAISEAAFQTRVIDTAKLYGWHVHHCRVARTADGWRVPITGDSGFPDLLLTRAGVVICAELKTDTGRLTANQALWIAELRTHGRVWRPKHWPQILAELRLPNGDAA
jgi:hypothetical protein